MASDIELDGKGVIIKDSQRILMEGSRNGPDYACDLMLDCKERRDPNNAAPDRRALVHWWNDVLDINFRGDYCGGVTINGGEKGNVEIIGNLKSAGIENSGNINTGTLDVKENLKASIIENSEKIKTHKIESISDSSINIGNFEQAENQNWGIQLGRYKANIMYSLLPNGRIMDCYVDSIIFRSPSLNMFGWGSALAQTNDKELVLNQYGLFENGVVIEGKNGLKIGDFRIFPHKLVDGTVGLRIISEEASLIPPSYGHGSHSRVNCIIFTGKRIMVETISESHSHSEKNKPSSIHRSFDLWDEIEKLKARVNVLENKQ